MKKLIASIISIYAALLMVGCGKNSSGGTTTVVQTCASGQIWNGTVCVADYGIAPNSKVQMYDYNRYFYSNYSGWATQNGDMTIVNSAAFQEFLKQAMGVCDRIDVGWNWGSSKCSNWVGGSFQLDVTIDSSLKPTVTFTAYPEINWFSSWGGIGFDFGGAAFNPLYLAQNNTFSLINQSKGYEIRAQGSYWNGGGLKLIQVQVPTGTLKDTTVSYDLYFPYNNVATKIATGKLKRR